ncbi:hypothetical protein R3P38DRAFT_3119258 [Favolaschia claudopus]|uniref:Fungal-type protein kinase domain-containing protein n=1 Tax=Favolaschia claudopus TaxID=2862362 RepID=A0AAV9ZDP9_9AGAR
MVTTTPEKHTIPAAAAAESGLHSTPLARGMAASGEHASDQRSRLPQNMALMQEDLEHGHNNVDFCALLQALCPEFPRVLESSKSMMGEIASVAEPDLKAYCEASNEKKRYIPFINVVNVIKEHFRGVQCPNKLPQPAAPEELIFVCNDPRRIDSAALKKSGTKKTSPDCIIIRVETFVNMLQDSDVSADESFETLRVTASKQLKGSTLRWSDILASVEFKYGRKIGGYVLGEPEITGLSAANLAGGSKRSREESRDSPSLKRSKTETNSTSHVQGETRTELILNAEQQCGFYALERLRAGPFISHTITILLQDRHLSVQYYDAQGRIASKSTDFIQNFDIFIAFICVLDRFDAQDWGSLTTPDPLFSFEFDTTSDQVGRPFAIRGRRTFACPTKNIHPAKDEPALLFLKTSWSEDRRMTKEYDILTEARQRADRHLPDSIIGFVTDCLPICIKAGTLALTSTRAVRQQLGIPTDGSRSLVWMVSKQLSEFNYRDHLDEPERLWRMIWKILRCHNLLWRVGVSHGDISLSNLMIDVARKPHGQSSATEQDDDGDPWIILSDYDLGALMAIGDESPPQMGFERTGTLPFLSTELLSNPSGNIPRKYAHDLESFAFVLLWIARGGFPPAAIGGALDAVRDAKVGLVLEDVLRSRPENESRLQNLSQSWAFLREWFRQIMSRKIMDTPTPDMSGALGELKEALTRSHTASPIDLGWMDCILIADV